MSDEKKRRVGEDAASEQPRGEPDTRQVQAQDDISGPLDSLSGFPRHAIYASEAWHRRGVMRARSVTALKHHLRYMVARHAMAMRELHDGWPDYYPAVIQSAVKASGLRVRFRTAQLREYCQAAIAALQNFT